MGAYPHHFVKKWSHSIIFAILLGIVMGLAAKLVDVPEILGAAPIFDEIGGRFGIWIFTATLLAAFSNTPLHAAVRVFCFFVSMLLTYYVYTVLFLGFFPKSQIILWGLISLVSPFCGAIMWYAHTEKWFSNILAALPVTALCTEWYLTGKENILLLLTYLCMSVSLLRSIPRCRKQWIPVAVIAAAVAFILTGTGVMNFVFEELLNI